MSETEEMQPSDQVRVMVRAWEGVIDGNPATVHLDPYLGPSNIVFIGWGHLVRDPVLLQGQEGLRRAREIYPDGIVRYDAERFLADDILLVAANVNKHTHVKLEQWQFDALCCFAFNLDPFNPNAFENCLLLKYINRGQFYIAGEEFEKWTFAAGGVQLDSLKRRRGAERRMFMFGSWQPDGTSYTTSV